MPLVSVSTYQRLRDQVKQTLLLGQQKIEALKVQTYWETGHMINQYIQRNKTPYLKRGEHVAVQLAKDLQIGEKVLYRCLRFAESFPNFSARRNLAWSHYRALISIEDDKKRLSLADQAEREDWSSRELEIHVRNLRSKTGPLKPKPNSAEPSLAAVELLKPLRGTPYTYRIKDLVIDLGFKIYRSLAAETSKVFEPGTLVELALEGKPLELVKSKRSEKDLFTYRARLEKVIDGDTLKVEIDLGFDTTIRETLRLRGLDCPEIDTGKALAEKTLKKSSRQGTRTFGAGERAKKFVESSLAGLKWVTITSSRSDKYDRYLADIYYETKDTEKFLNNQLLEQRHAVRMND